MAAAKLSGGGMKIPFPCKQNRLSDPLCPDLQPKAMGLQAFHSIIPPVIRE
jgi:hypothetical protein